MHLVFCNLQNVFCLFGALIFITLLDCKKIIKQDYRPETILWWNHSSSNAEICDLKGMCSRGESWGTMPPSLYPTPLLPTKLEMMSSVTWYLLRTAWSHVLSTWTQFWRMKSLLARSVMTTSRGFSCSDHLHLQTQLSFSSQLRICNVLQLHIARLWCYCIYIICP